MSIENLYGKHGKAITCDNCGEGFETKSWDEALEEMRAQGWQKRKVDGEYKHYCPECQQGI
jgi:Fe2+ or Zn2+ uptake regulation protein